MLKKEEITSKVPFKIKEEHLPSDVVKDLQEVTQALKEKGEKKNADDISE